MSLDRASLGKVAERYWQNGLAKFDPKRKETTGFERAMFRYGAEYAHNIAVEVIQRIESDLRTGQGYTSSIESAIRALGKRIEGRDEV